MLHASEMLIKFLKYRKSLLFRTLQFEVSIDKDNKIFNPKSNWAYAFNLYFPPPPPLPYTHTPPISLTIQFRIMH